MNILLVLIPVTLLVIIIAVALFFWAVNHQQFDDLDSPGVLPLLDEPTAQYKADAGADSPSPLPSPAASARTTDPDHPAGERRQE
ncbi:MAG: cbb3-type cytochrome oxidase assembly protein CcoS [Rhodanobacter sp.]